MRSCEVTEEEFTYLLLKVNWDNDHVRYNCAAAGRALNKLYNDPAPEIRRMVAAHGYKLDVLINDPIDSVREVAEQAHKIEMYGEAKAMVDEMFNI